MKTQFPYAYHDIISLENLLSAWQEFVRGKRHKSDVQVFGFRLMDNIFLLHTDLREENYTHGPYEAFTICDPKKRDIHKASVRDRLLHHAVYRQLYPFFDRTFIANSFSCRNHKGTHKALNRFRAVVYKASRNHTQTCWVLKCDIRKFFASIHHEILKEILNGHSQDISTQKLLSKIIESFNSGKEGIGLPLGNLTSQLFANVYMNEFDQFVKHELKVRHYVRYADDFVLLSQDKRGLEMSIEPIRVFLRERLGLLLHEDKIIVKTIASGIDFLGWVHFPDHRVLRSATRRRMFRKLRDNPSSETQASYRGLLRYGNAWKLRQKIENMSFDTLG